MLVYEKEQRENILSRLKAKPYQVFYKPPLITVVHKEAGKKKGVLHICKVLAFPLEQVLIVGNSQKDWEMMSAVHHSCAVMNSGESRPPACFLPFPRIEKQIKLLYINLK